ncbi:MAG: tRNA (guanosine(46)-N7)-methyltransferase TrmB [Clostridia bacterium]|nr:tRNA (guanosine(46)-N7)-methyltransferase TrmB [Clostridia bacterium]
MRKKGNLEKRLKACEDIMMPADFSVSDMREAVQEKQYVDFEAFFGNSNPLHLEIGCGKGSFVCQLARQHPEINYIACEKVSNVIITAVERVKAEGIRNIYFFNCLAEMLEKYIPEGSVSRLYLNFSDPLLKHGGKRQRLTSTRFLELYQKLLCPGGEIWQKTDNEVLYRFSTDNYPSCGFEIVSTSEDWDSVANGDIETEYEQHFKEQGFKIFRIVARKS